MLAPLTLGYCYLTLAVDRRNKFYLKLPDCVDRKKNKPPRLSRHSMAPLLFNDDAFVCLKSVGFN